MSFVIDEPEPQPERRYMYGVPVIVSVVGGAGSTDIYKQSIVFPGPFVLRPEEELAVRIAGPSGEAKR